MGEATLSPSSYSILADLYRPERLTFAMSILLVGSTAGTGLAIGLGGMLVSFAKSEGGYYLPLIGYLEPWRFAFVVTGLPGLVLGLLIFLTKEPVRKDKISNEKVPFSESLAFLARQKHFFINHLLGFGLLAIIGWGLISWLPEYMVREFGWTIGQISLPLAFMMGIGGSLGVLISGRLVDYLYRQGRYDAHVSVYAFIAAGIFVFGVSAFLVNDPWLCLALLTPVVATISSAATAATALQIVTPNEMRGQVGALFLFVITGLGLGLGPTIIGALTDFLFMDEAKLGLSIAVVIGVCAPLATIFLVLAMKPMRNAVTFANEWRDNPRTMA